MLYAESLLCNQVTDDVPFLLVWKTQMECYNYLTESFSIKFYFDFFVMLYQCQVRNSGYRMSSSKHTEKAVSHHGCRQGRYCIMRKTYSIKQMFLQWNFIISFMFCQRCNCASWSIGCLKLGIVQIFEYVINSGVPEFLQFKTVKYLINSVKS